MDKFALTTLTELPISNEAVAATAEGVQRNVYLGRKNQPQTNAYREFNDTLRTHAAQMRVLSGRQRWRFVVDILIRPMLANGCVFMWKDPGGISHKLGRASLMWHVMQMIERL